jgi:predicted Fe-Mo cluster-binding NifX family protein
MWRKTLMKIAISATGQNLEAGVDPRFGRCQYFIIIDPDTMEYEVVANSGIAARGGAGISAAQMVAGRGVAAVLTGHCGPNAFEALDSAGIKVLTGVSGTVQDAVNNYKAGKYQASSQPNAGLHSGMGGGRGSGRG